MTALETIAAKAQEKGLKFLVIGGHAVMAHGFARSTYDLDLLVRANEQEQWLELFKEAGATIHSMGPSFVQFQPTADFPETTDLMLVNDQTFDQLWSDSIVPAGGYGQTRFVSLNHLIALKCHAIKHGHAGRVEKDVDDILELVKINHVGVTDEKFRQLILKHGLPELYDKSNESLASKSHQGESTVGDLVFPDWSGMTRVPIRISFKQAYEHNLKLIAMLPPKPDESNRRRARKCTVAFTL